MVHHGGNFQAASVTSAMEKTRLSLQMLGKLMFAQCTELINPQLNHILSPNLCFDDPDLSYTFKGIDINMASYQSELAFLANPVSTHVQSAEMHNQAVNSMALISARYTLDAVELVSLMTSAFLYALCQALDLHVLYIEYMTLIEKKARPAFEEKFSSVLSANDLKPYFRVNSLFFDPNVYGRFLALVMVVLAGVLLWAPARRDVARVAVGLALLWAALVLTLSESSFAALLVGLAVLASAARGDTGVHVAIATAGGVTEEKALAFLGGDEGRRRAALSAASILWRHLGRERPERPA